VREPLRRFFVISYILAVTSPACTVVEHVGRPPSAGEIARINETSANGRNLAVESTVNFLGYATQQPACAGGGCGARVEPLRVCVDGACEVAPRDTPRIKDPPRAITFADAQQVTFDTRLGGTLALPMNIVTGVKVSGTNRPLGAAIGLAVGAFVDLGVGSFIFVGRSLLSTDDGGSNASRCTATCGAEIAAAMLPALIGGALAGAAIGVPHRFVFGDGATTP
jgi:hypothetical protein